MEIILVRHAQPEWSRDGRSQVDPGLTDLGRQQAALTADRLGVEAFDGVLVSTATRSQETAEPVLPRLGEVRRVDREWLHEIRMPGTWQGTPSEEVDRAFRDARGRPRMEWWNGMPGVRASAISTAV